MKNQRSGVLTDEFGLYVFNGKNYFYGWNNWSVVGELLFLHPNMMEKIVKNSRLKKDNLYSMTLSIDRDCDDPEKVFNWECYFEVVKKNQIKEVKRIANEVRSFEEEDKDIWADLLDELVLELKKAGLK